MYARVHNLNYTTTAELYVDETFQQFRDLALASAKSHMDPFSPSPTHRGRAGSSMVYERGRHPALDWSTKNAAPHSTASHLCDKIIIYEYIKSKYICNVKCYI